MKTELIRTWKHEGIYINSKPFELRLYLTDKWDNRTGRQYVGYELLHDGKVIFDGEDFSPSPMHELDSDEAVENLICFLSMRPGDVEEDYFKDYTPEQLEWAVENGEEMSALWLELEEELGLG